MPNIVSPQSPEAQDGRSDEGRGIRLDQIDHAILRALVADARLPNNTLAATVGVAPSTCLLRLRRLRNLSLDPPRK